MRWNEIVQELSALCIWPVGNPGITGVEYDSRRVGSGSLFVAMQGGTANGNMFIDEAIGRGVVAIVTDDPETAADVEARGLPCALVRHGRRALAEASAAFFHHPERALAVTAITGTNGKTTTAYLLEQLLTMAGRKCILIGTVETRIAGRALPSQHTTPEASDLLRIFADGVAAGCTEVVMEMSSHALAQERVWGVPVDVAIFTNLTQDHLDFHGSMNQYAQAKAKLFNGEATGAMPRVAVLRAEDKYSLLMSAAFRGKSLRYGESEEFQPDWRASNIAIAPEQTTFDLDAGGGSAKVISRLSGRINVQNLLAAMCAAVERGISMQDVVRYAERLCAVPGRFETVANELGFTVVVDYAHTDDALRNLISIAREQVSPHDGRVITVFGCGGDRDRTKRPKMGRVAGEGSDIVIITSDNPRSEDPAGIIREILAGVQGSRARVVIEQDRRRAVAAAIAAAHTGDIVLIAGKGHEKVQIIGTESLPFDDVAVSRQILAQMQKGRTA